MSDNYNDLSTSFAQSSSRLAPHSQESEEAVIGSVLINPDSYYLTDVIKLPPDAFYFLSHTIIWTAIRAIMGDEKTRFTPNLDNLILGEELRRMSASGGQSCLDLVGGQAKLTSLTNNTPTYLNVETYAQMVWRLNIKRRLAEAGRKIQEYGMTDQMDLEEAMGSADLAIQEVLSMRMHSRYIEPLNQVMTRRYLELEDMQSRGVKPSFPTGYTALDSLVGGHFKGGTAIIAGTSGTGKTTLMANMAWSAADKYPYPIGVFSLEMPSEEMSDRFASVIGGINANAIRDLDMQDDDWRRYQDSTATMERRIKKGGGIYIDGEWDHTTSTLRAAMIRMKRENNVEVFFVDYGGLIQLPPDVKVSSSHPYHQFEIIAKKLNRIARELQVAIVILCQITSDSVVIDGKAPRLNDLAGTIEWSRNAKWVLMIGSNNPDGADNYDGQLFFYVTKSRHGKKGKIRGNWESSILKYDMLEAYPYSAQDKPQPKRKRRASGIAELDEE